MREAVLTFAVCPASLSMNFASDGGRVPNLNVLRCTVAFGFTDFFAPLALLQTCLEAVEVSLVRWNKRLKRQS